MIAMASEPRFPAGRIQLEGAEADDPAAAVVIPFRGPEDHGRSYRLARCGYIKFVNDPDWRQ
jgi:hypothetical protein